MVISVFVKCTSKITVSSTNANLTILSLYRDSGTSNFMPRPDNCIISISGSLTETQIFGPDPLPWKISQKGMGGSLCINDSRVPYYVLMWCSISCNVCRMHFIGCAGMPNFRISVLATDCTIRP